MTIALIAHGGAGNWRPGSEQDALQGMRSSVEAGRAILRAGGTALDAVCATVVVLEDDPVFNAGRVAALTADGGVEHDASVMEGTTRFVGAVAGVEGVRNPVRAARAVLRDGHHVLLVGKWARQFAADHGVELCDPDWPVTDEQRAVLASGDLGWAAGTVGAVARDARGRLAAATSTGGTMGKRRGRVGDSPLIGAGTWADDDTVAVSCTGDGEAIIRIAMAHEVEALVRLRGIGLEEACAEALRELDRRGGHGGLIAVSAAGEIAAQFSSPGMTRGWRVGDGPVETAVGGG